MTLFGGELYLLMQQEVFKYSYAKHKMLKQFEYMQVIDIWNNNKAIILATADAVFAYNGTLSKLFDAILTLNDRLVAGGIATFACE